MRQEILKRFIHRADTYSVQWYTTEKGIGYQRITKGVCPEGCAKNACPHVTNAPITDTVLQDHLSGYDTIGVYPLDEDNTVKWACIDVDIKKYADEDDLTDRVQRQTLLVAKTLKALIGPRFLVENSGGRGYHLWVFFSEPVPGRQALALLNYVDQHTTKVDGISLELFPKRTVLKGYGNMVKLPLGVHRKTGCSCLFVNSSWEPYENQYDVLHSIRVLSLDELNALIKKYKIEVEPSIRINPGSDGKIGTTSLPCQTRMMAEGLGEGCRDDGMFAVGCFLRDRGVPLDMAEVAMIQLNERNQPPLHGDIVLQKVQSAYAREQSPTPCYKPTLDQFCSSSCRFWKGKVDERWTRYGKKSNPVGIISRD